MTSSVAKVLQLPHLWCYELLRRWGDWASESDLNQRPSPIDYGFHREIIPLLWPIQVSEILRFTQN